MLLILAYNNLNPSYNRLLYKNDKMHGLGMLSIENNVLPKLEYENLISNFTSQKARIMIFK
jgi:hypothetical protein